MLDQIGGLETIQESRPLNDDEQLLKAHLAMEYEEAARNGEIFGGRDPESSGSNVVIKTLSSFTEWPLHVRDSTQ